MADDKILDQSNLIKNLNLDKLPLGKQEELMENMNDIILDRVLIRIFRDFDSRDIETFNDLLDEEKNLEAIAFLKEKAPDFDKIVEEEISSFQKEIVQILM